MAVLSEDFVRKIFRAFEEEEEDLYVLTMHYLNSEDLNFFEEKNRVKIRKILEVLIHDTKQHSELLKLILELAEK